MFTLFDFFWRDLLMKPVWHNFTYFHIQFSFLILSYFPDFTCPYGHKCLYLHLVTDLYQLIQFIVINQYIPFMIHIFTYLCIWKLLWWHFKQLWYFIQQIKGTSWIFTLFTSFECILLWQQLDITLPIFTYNFPSIYFLLELILKNLWS